MNSPAAGKKEGKAGNLIATARKIVGFFCPAAASQKQKG